MYDDICLPTDGSDAAERAVEHGLDLAARTDATVHAVYVVDGTRYGETPALSTHELALDALAKGGDELTEAVASRAREREVDAVTAVERGVPHEEIVDYAEGAGVDLIVMGRTGGGDSETRLGSVTDRVLRTTSIPVLPV